LTLLNFVQSNCRKICHEFINSTIIENFQTIFCAVIFRKADDDCGYHKVSNVYGGEEISSFSLTVFVTFTNMGLLGTSSGRSHKISLQNEQKVFECSSVVIRNQTVDELCNSVIGSACLVFLSYSSLWSNKAENSVWSLFLCKGVSSLWRNRCKQSIWIFLDYLWNIFAARRCSSEKVYTKIMKMELFIFKRLWTQQWFSIKRIKKFKLCLELLNIRRRTVLSHTTNTKNKCHKRSSQNYVVYSISTWILQTFPTEMDRGWPTTDLSE